MTEKEFNLFDEYVASGVHLSPQKECTSSSWGDSKIYTFGSIANWQRMLLEINESGPTVKLRIWVESDSGGSRTAATSKMEHFVIIVNGWKRLTIITMRSILDVAAVLDPPLGMQTNIMLVDLQKAFNTLHQKFFLKIWHV